MQVRAVHQVGVVRDHRDVGVDHGVLSPEHLDARPGHRQRDAGFDGLVIHRDLGAAELPRRPAVHDQPRVRIRPQQRGEALEVEVVRVLVGDEHGVQAGHVLEVRREVPRVDQQPGRTGVEQHARVSEVGDLHEPTLPPP